MLDYGSFKAQPCFFASTILVSFLPAANPDNNAGQEGSTSNIIEVTSPDVTDGDTSQSDGVFVDELGESIKSEGGESLKDMLDKNKEKKEVGEGCKVELGGGGAPLAIFSTPKKVSMLREQVDS